MKILKQLILLTLLTLVLHSQPVSTNNYGCKQFRRDGTCKQCSFRYYMDNQSICQPVNTNCNTYNPITGACLSCYSGFQLVQTTCLDSSTTSPTNQQPNCYRYLNGNCLQCSQGFYFNSLGRCTQVSPLCNTWEPTTGRCLTCYRGYTLQNGACVVATVALDPFCNTFVGNTCTKCSQGYYFNNLNICTKIDDNCQTFNAATATCTRCYQGYTLNANNQCVVSNISNNNTLCRVWTNNVCTQCSQGSYFNAQQICTEINPLCKTFNFNTKVCQGCYNGYNLVNGDCVAARGGTNDDFCSRFVNNACVQCSFRYFLDGNARCQLISPLCNAFNSTNGNCITCYVGYVLAGTSCVLSSNTNTDPLCGQWSGTTCLSCSVNAYFGPNGICIASDPLCKTFNASNGNCLSCYSGYILQGGKCAVDNGGSNRDPNCNQFLNDVCQQCSQRFYFNSNRVCVGVDPNCNSFQPNDGTCLTCYGGYSLSNGRCIVIPSGSDSNCQTYSGANCIKCLNQFYLDTSGKCQPVNVLCKTYDNSGNCTSCFNKFVLTNGNCVAQSNTNTPTIPNCDEVSADGTYCTKCSTNRYLDVYGGCTNTEVIYDSNCADWRNLICISCKTGYNFSKGFCSPAN